MNSAILEDQVFSAISQSKSGMANKLDPMDLKQIISLHLDGLSNRDIGSTLGISRNTINNYMKLFKSSKLDLNELLLLDNGGLKELFTLRTTIKNDRYDSLMVFFEGMNAAKNHPGFTFQYHYQEYKNTSENPYSYTQFMEHYRPSLHIHSGKYNYLFEPFF